MAEITLDEALRIALDGDAVLFVGAGVGYLVDGPNGSLPDGPTLSNRMLGRADDAPSPHPLDKAVGHVLRHLGGAEKVYDILRDNLTVNSVNPGLEDLYSIPWRRIYTTNYDDAIEKSRRGKVITNSCTLEDGVEKVKVGTILHINGYFNRVSPSSIERDLSLSDRSYAVRDFENYQWHRIFIRDMETARAVIFIGYSIYDLDISRMLFSSNISDKAFFFVSPGVDDVEKSSIEIYGRVVEGGADILIGAAERISQQYTPVSISAGFINLRELKSDSAESSRNPTRTLDKQFVFGILPEQQSLSGELAFDSQPFLVKRHQQIETEDNLRRGIIRDIAIVGELASGKSATALSFCSHFFQQGYRVFVAEKGAMLADELARLATVDDRVVVVFEGYAGLRDQIRSYALARNAKHRMILTEQAIHHESVGDFIYEPTFSGRMSVIVLDKIDRRDTRVFAELINFGGYWGERSGANIDAQARYISSNLDGSMYKILLEIIESEDIQKRISTLLGPVFVNDAATKIFVAACMANVIGIEFRVSDWPMLFDPSGARRVLSNFKTDLSYFVAVQSDRVFPRNGLLSASILRRVPDRSLVVRTATELFGVAARLRTPRDLYDDVHVQMMRFNVIEPILQGPNSKSLILRYYDDIRPLADTRNLSDYWLQLGIAATVLENLSVAKDAFTNAYARERRKSRPNTKKIDNYFARYQLKAAAASDVPEDAYDLFVRGTNGISKQIFLDDNKHYPFKSGRSYGEIASKHYLKWTVTQQAHFISATNEIRDRAIQWQSRNSIHNADVDYLIRETGDLLRRMGQSVPPM